jgi:hypothetical protein
LKETRNIDFGELVYDGEIIDITKNPSGNFKEQERLIVKKDDKAYSVPFVREGDDILFLKTAYRSRKLDKNINK